MTHRGRDLEIVHHVPIGDRRIGEGQPAYIVAEAGVNHDGRLDKAMRLVEVAADAGADAVKFQVFRAADLATGSAPTAKYQQDHAGGDSQQEMLEGLELSDDAFAAIRMKCVEHSIEFLATPFAPPDLDRLLALDVRALKIASTDLNNTPLLRAAAATGLPLIVSTGAATRDEIAVCVDLLSGLGVGDRLILLHCVSCYPTPLEDANLRAIAGLQRAFSLPCGYSDHTVSTQTGAWAVAAGACVLEKHFTLDQTAAGPDHAMSLAPDELIEYVRSIRAAEQALGDGAIGLSELESEVRRIARKSVVAAVDIRAGSELTADLLTLKRPGGGIQPDQLESLIGRRVAVDVPGDTTLTWRMIQ